MFASVKIRHRRWRKVGQAGQKERLPLALHGNGSAAVFRLRGEEEQDQVAWPERAGRTGMPGDEAVQADGSDGALAGGCCWAASIRNDFGVQPNSSLNSLLK